ncbi:MAG TPA: hypothetical protein VH141_33355 [Pseudonocardia sp.]|jgi:hypothetical protein|nr:hypothetical protein [Pseudonocardia sp.]
MAALSFGGDRDGLIEAMTMREVQRMATGIATGIATVGAVIGAAPPEPPAARKT